MKTIPNLKHSARDVAFADHSPWRRWVFLVSLGLSALGCSAESKSDPVTSSQTHWLKHCEKASDCSGDFSCSCGVCTSSCDDNASCSDLGSRAVCAPTDGVAACGNSAPSNICVQSCGEDDECGAKTMCVDGACVPLAEGEDAGGSEPPPPPPGVQCSDYVGCDVETRCADGLSCYSFAGCGGGICIDGEEACTLSCPEDADCVSLDSYPAQLSCEGIVPAIPGDPMTGEPAPEGLNCDEYCACNADTPCAEGDCIAFDECGGGICVPTDEACAATCPDQDDCAVAESYPLQIFCEGRVAPHAGAMLICDPDVDPPTMSEDAGAGPAGVDCSAHPTCAADRPCDTGDCITIRGCAEPLCISTDLACEQTCGSDDCMVLESYPLQLGCEGYVEGHGESQPPSAVDAGSDEPVTCGDNVCAAGERCCNHCTGACTSLEFLCPDDADPNHSCDDGGTPRVECGDTTCAANERCCDSCAGTCAPLTAEIACPNDNDPAPMCDTADTFACGTEGCDASTSYCLNTEGNTETFSCEAWPDECADDHSCACLGVTDGPCADSGTGEVTVTVAQP